MKLYSLRIYESDNLVHEFVPYSDNGVACLYDTVDKVVKKDARNGNAFVIGGMGVDGAERWAKSPQDVTVKPYGIATINAIAAGAVRYIWKTDDGKILAGAGGEDLTVVWERGVETKTYTVTPVYLVNGEETQGEPVAVTVTNQPLGLIIIVR